MEEQRARTRQMINTKCLKRLFPGIESILCMCKMSTVYFFDETAGIWLKSEQFGPFFLCQAQGESCKLVVLNQNSKTDLCLQSDDIKRFSLQAEDNMLYFRLNNDEIKGLWFFEKTDLLAVYETLKAKYPDKERGQPGSQQTQEKAKVVAQDGAIKPKEETDSQSKTQKETKSS